MATEASRAPSVREQTTAPRIPAHPESMAATFAAARAGGAPIAADSPLDEAFNILVETRSIGELLSAGYDDAECRGVFVGEMISRRANTYARALDGLTRMIALAEFHITIAQEASE